MPPRILRDVLIVDRSTLACSMYPFLFTSQNRFRLRFSDEFASLMKRSRRLRPDLLVVNSNSLPRGNHFEFPCPTILIISEDRVDLKEEVGGKEEVVLIEKPFYPYDLISIANRLVPPKAKKVFRKRKLG